MLACEYVPIQVRVILIGIRHRILHFGLEPTTVAIAITATQPAAQSAAQPADKAAIMQPAADLDAQRVDRNSKLAIFVGFIVIARLVPPALRKLGF